MPASQIDDQIIIQKSPWQMVFSIMAKSYHPKGPFIAEIVGPHPQHEFQRLWLGSKNPKNDTCLASFELVTLISKPKLLHIRGALQNYYLLYVDLKNEPVLWPIFSKTEVAEWLQAKQLWYEIGQAPPLPPYLAASTSHSSMATAMSVGQYIDPPAGKRRIKLG